ncbi:MAG: tRNA lysidine(34) synthetase TilS [Solibacillus sp.]
MHGLEHRVLDFIRQHHLIKKGERLLVACSGGVDSMALLTFFVKFKEQLGVEVVVAHVDHMLRGEESHGDRLFVEQFCERYELQVVSCAIPIADIAEKRGGNIQSICREERYRFFSETMERLALDTLLTAHHADDQLESMLMALTKSANVGSLTGIQASRDFNNKKIIRPFLAVTKLEIREYLQDNGGGFREDASNAKDTYTRNRFRHRIVPLLKEENAHVSANVVHLTEQLQADQAYLQQLAEARFSAIFTKRQNNSYKMEISALQKEPLALQRRLILILLNYLYNDSTILQSYALCTTILKLCETVDGTVTIDLPEDFTARREYASMLFEKKQQHTFAPATVALNEWNDFGALRIFIGNPEHVELQSDAAEKYYFSAQTVNFPFYVRAREDGDRMTVLGMQKGKKVSRIFIDDKIPLVERDCWPLLVDAHNSILAVLAVRVNDKFSTTRRVADDTVLAIERISI